MALTLEQINNRLLEIEQERQQLLFLKEQLLAATFNESNVLSVSEKIYLFKQRFGGRTDIYANRWQNKQGKSGYSVACDNEWVSGVCQKPKIKCQDCNYRQFSALTDQVIYEHLIGKKVVGLYPLLPDNTCYLLVADFDKKNWQQEVQAMSQACDFYKVPHLIEISRSGNGAHLWVFFSEAVLAKDARALGFRLLDKAMEMFSGLSFDSYDRLFPNQDLMPEGGFGNLIALPLQKKARQSGNSSFVDQNLVLLSDPWMALQQVGTLSVNDIDRILADVVPQSLTLIENPAPDKPWEITQQPALLTLKDKPEAISITLANQIYFDLTELPSELVARLRRIATFSNPVFYKTQALRFSTHGIPRFISCANIISGYLSLPRGCLDDAVKLLQSVDIEVSYDDRRQHGQAIAFGKVGVDFRKEQKKAIRALLKHDTGILHAPTAFGKTVTAMGLIVKRGVNTLILVHSRQLLDQWKQRINTFLPDVEVGLYGAGKKKASNIIDIATYQSLVDRSSNEVNSIVQGYGHVIVDECHHLSAPKYEQVMNEVRAKFVLGLTATPERQDGHQKIIFMNAGPIRFKADLKNSEFVQRVIVKSTYQTPAEALCRHEQRPKISDIYQWLADNQERNQLICNDVIEVVSQGRHPIILTERREHAETLSTLLKQKGIDVVTLRGGMGVKQRKEVNEQLISAQVVVATGKYVGEGFDLPRLDTLFLAMPIAWKGSLAQYAGRIQRQSEAKTEVIIFDYVDENLPMLQRMFAKREKSYKALGYQSEYAISQEVISLN